VPTAPSAFGGNDFGSSSASLANPLVCSPADARDNIAELPAIADVEDFHLVPFPQLLAECRGLRAAVGV